MQVDGQNDQKFNEVQITDQEFKQFLEVNNTTAIPEAVIENNDDMRGSYVMIDPAGRFYDSAKGHHTYSLPILDIGVHQALSMVTVDPVKFYHRGGIYDWR